MCALCWQWPFLEAARGFITPILYKLKKKDFRWEINLSKSVLEQKKPKKFFEHLDFLWTFLSKKYTKQLFFWDLNLNCVRLISLNALQLEHSRKKNWEWSAGWLSILKGLSWKTSLAIFQFIAFFCLHRSDFVHYNFDLDVKWTNLTSDMFHCWVETAFLRK